MSEAQTEVTPELLHTASHLVWINKDLATGSGISAMIAPNVFGVWQDGIECVRFGKIAGVGEFDPIVMPLLPELLDISQEAADSDPGENIYVKPIGEGETAEDLWQTFFKTQLKAVASLAGHALVTLPMNNEPEPWAINNFEYAASIIDPTSPAKVIEPSGYDSFDALTYLGVTVASDQERRQAIAEKLTNTGSLRFFDVQKLLDEIDDIYRDPLLR